MSKEKEHPLTNYSESDKEAYLSIAALVVSADKEVSDQEINNIRNLCKKVNLSIHGIAKIISISENPEESDIEGSLEILRGSELRYTLIIDMFLIAYSDDKVTKDERELIFSIADNLKISRSQVESMRNYVAALIKLQKSKGKQVNTKDLIGEAISNMASVGIPVSAVAASGSVIGLSAAGITSGLAALGLGLGMVGGLGVVAGLGAASYFGVKFLWNKIT